MQEVDVETALKVLVVGNGGVGKSSMIQRFCKGVFTKDYKKTIGVDFLEKVVTNDDDDEEIRLMVWDTAGQEEFDVMTKNYYKDAHCCAIVFSSIDRDSFDAVERWIGKVQSECGDSVAMVLVQNKVDLLDESVVEAEEAEQLAKSMRLKLYRTSVKENLQVDDVFEYLTRKYFKMEGDKGVEPEVNARKIGLFEADAPPPEPTHGHAPASRSTSGFQVQKPTKTRDAKAKKDCLIQ